MDSSYDNTTLLVLSFLIRTSVGHSLFAAHHGLSQLIASFFGVWCLGIHPVLLLACSLRRMFKFLLFLPLPALQRQGSQALGSLLLETHRAFYFDLSISFRILRYEVFKVRLRTVSLRNPVFRSAY